MNDTDGQGASRSDSGTGSDAKRKKRPSVETISHLVSTLFILGSVALGGYQWILREYTEPVAGYVDSHIPSFKDAPSVFMREWILNNPGPGDLDDPCLSVDVSDHFDEATNSFSSGLVVQDGPGVSHEVKDNGHGSRITFRCDGGKLNCWQSLRCKFCIQRDTWSATSATAILSGHVPVEANLIFNDPPRQSTNLILPAFLFLIGIGVLVMNKLSKSQFAKILDEKLADAERDFKASATTIVQETLDAAEIPENMLRQEPPRDDTSNGS